MPFIDANGVSLHYELAGARGRSVVLLHELGGTLHSWDAVVPRLAARFRVLRYDQRGSGGSEKVRREFSNDTLVGDFAALAEGVGLASRPIISSPSPPPPLRRCAFSNSIPIGSARWSCATRRRAWMPAARRRSTSAPHLPRARACAPRCRRRWRSLIRRRSASRRL